MRKSATLFLSAGLAVLAGAWNAGAQGDSPGLAQVVALDECDPTTFNAFAGPDFCKNVTLGAFTTLSDLLAGAEGNSRSWLGLRARHLDDQAGDDSLSGQPGRRAAHFYRGASVRQWIPAAAQPRQRHQRHSRMQWRI